MGQGNSYMVNMPLVELHGKGGVTEGVQLGSQGQQHIFQQQVAVQPQIQSPQQTIQIMQNQQMQQYRLMSPGTGVHQLAGVQPQVHGQIQGQNPVAQGQQGQGEPPSQAGVQAQLHAHAQTQQGQQQQVQQQQGSQKSGIITTP